MLSITIICVGRLKETYFADAVQEYKKRLSSYCRLNLEEVPESRVTGAASPAEIETALAKEADAIELRIPKGALVMAACIEGKQLSSEQLSEFLQVCERNGKARLCILVGGSHGLHSRLKARAELKLSMSKMTFPHHLFRVMLLEQIYRAYKIAEGGKYHK